MEWNLLLSPYRFNQDVIYTNDYDTIICSTLFRRLQDKAQVFPLDEDDYVRTRLTHSLEVSAIGKRLGEYVFSSLRNASRDPWFESHSEKEFSDVLLCAGLVHDIGNPPYGHFGEYAIREWFRNNLGSLRLGGRRVTELLSEWQCLDLYSFEGNAQSLRLLSKTPYLGRMCGFNLSYSILGAIMKYPISSYGLAHDNPDGLKKIGYYSSEQALFEDLQQKLGLEGHRHPLSYLLEASDDIAYRTSDLEDALVKKVITLPEITEALKPFGLSDELDGIYEAELHKGRHKPELIAVQKWNQQLQSRMIRDAGSSFLAHYDELMQGSFRGDLFDGTRSGEVISAIADLSERLIYTSSLKTRTELYGRRIISSLLDQFMPAAVVYDSGLPVSFIEDRTMDTVSEFYKSIYRSEAEGRSEGDRLFLRLLMITDYISGMTDSYARRLYQELF